VVRVPWLNKPLFLSLLPSLWAPKGGDEGSLAPNGLPGLTHRRTSHHLSDELTNGYTAQDNVRVHVCAFVCTHCVDSLKMDLMGQRHKLPFSWTSRAHHVGLHLKTANSLSFFPLFPRREAFLQTWARWV
jgi:hypothetical protein